MALLAGVSAWSPTILISPDSANYVLVYLLRPDNSIRASFYCYNDPNCLLDPVDYITSSATALETSGTWTVSLHTLYENSAGSAQLRLYTVTDQTGSIASDGTAVTSTITVPGQRSIFTFAGTAGQRFSTLTTPATGFPNSYYVYFRRPDGSLYYVTAGSDTSPIHGESTLDQTGEWAVVFDPLTRGTGNTSIQLYRPVDQTGSIPTNGTAQTVTIGTPGQNAALSFTGTAGQRLSIALSDVALGDCSAYSTANIRLQRPDGSEFSTQLSYYCSGGFLEFGALDQSGTWTIILDPQGALTGSATLRLYAATDTTATIATNGTAQTATFTTPGQASRFTFSATGGQRYSVRVSGASLTPDTGGLVSLDRPDGTSVASIGFNTGADAFIDPFEFDQTGTWTVRVDPYVEAIGTASVQVYAITDQTGTIATNGTARAVNITTPGQNARFTFTGSVGQSYSLRSSDNVFGTAQYQYGYMRLRRPDGSALNDTAFYTSSGFAEPVVLDQAGTWTVQVDPIGGDTLTGNIQLQLISDQTGTIATNGTALAVNLSTPGQRALLSFSGTAGQRYSLRLTDAAFSIYGYSNVSLVRPDGTALVNTPLYGASGFVEPFRARPDRNLDHPHRPAAGFDRHRQRATESADRPDRRDRHQWRGGDFDHDRSRSAQPPHLHRRSRCQHDGDRARRGVLRLKQRCSQSDPAGWQHHGRQQLQPHRRRSWHGFGPAQQRDPRSGGHLGDPARPVCRSDRHRQRPAGAQFHRQLADHHT